jgi:hypothetical protein
MELLEGLGLDNHFLVGHNYTMERISTSEYLVYQDKNITCIVDLERCFYTCGRNIVVVKIYDNDKLVFEIPFYKSTGINSKNKGIWFPFSGAFFKDGKYHSLHKVFFVHPDKEFIEKKLEKEINGDEITKLTDELKYARMGS